MRRRLALVFAAVTTMVAVAFIVPLSIFVRDVARERAIDDANRDASALFPILAATDSVDVLGVAISRTPAGTAGRLSVYLAADITIGAAIAPDDRVLAALREARAWSGAVSGGEAIVAPVVRADGSTAAVRVFVPNAMLREGVWSAWVTLTAVGAALVIGSVLLADRFARSVTGPMSELATAAHHLGRGELSARVTPAGPPEIVEVGAAFNVLAQRVVDLLHAEREDVADLAHRLRTPLTALRLQIEQVDDAAVRAQLAESADDLGRSLDSVIFQARRRSRDDLAPSCDLRVIVAERAAFWGALAEEQHRDASLVLPDGAMLVALATDEVAAVLDVLLENVFAHTPDATAYSVDVRTDGRRAVLTIADVGPGFAHGDVVSRGASAGSTGLGLDIARRTVIGAGGSFSVARPADGGAQVQLTLPLVDQRSS